MSLITVAPRGWLQVVAETCRSTFVNQILMQLFGNKLVYMHFPCDAFLFERPVE